MTILDEALIRLVVCIFWLLLSFLVGRMATSYKRSSVAWFLLALVFSPVIAWIFLIVADVPHSAFVLNEKEERVRQHYSDESESRNTPLSEMNESDLRDIALSETQCPKCGTTVNPATGEGLHSSESEPWLLICDHCETMFEPDI